MWLRESKSLKPVHRACLILRYVHGMNRDEIARRLGLTETQVKGHLQYARTLLRRELENVTK
jgi:RNA polymerase sigma-70 factor (ECF subfamily)